MSDEIVVRRFKTRGAEYYRETRQNIQQVRGVSPEKASRVLAHRLGDGLFNDRIGNAVTAKTLRHNCNRTAFLPSEIFPERLADVETDVYTLHIRIKKNRNKMMECLKSSRRKATGYAADPKTDGHPPSAFRYVSGTASPSKWAGRNR
jgi:hypothetical protein